MLSNLKILGERIKQKIGEINTWPEIEFTESDIKELLKIDNTYMIYKSSILIKISGGNHCIIPSQYLLYAIAIKEFAMVLKEYMSVFNQLKEKLSSAELYEIVNSNNTNIELLNSLDEFSKKNVFKPFNDEEYRFKAKSIFNKKENDWITRGDFFQSFVLKLINVPDATSGILGDLILSLSDHEDVYKYFEKKYLKLLPFIYKSNIIKDFIKSTIEFLKQYDNLDRLNPYIIQNDDKRLLSLKMDEYSLTSIFRISKTLLNEKDLTQGDKIRYFEDPLFLIGEEYYYLSTEWTNDKERRLDLQTYKIILEKVYPEFNIETENNTFIFSAGNKVSIQNKRFNNTDFMTALENSNLKYSPEITTSLTSAIITKPFVILTGLSGSGKTKLAQAFAERICVDESQLCLIPVGADWTSREPLLGYPNALVAKKYVKPDNGIVDLLIMAAKKENCNKPYFLILDEMNLSHVERYFADFLSVMEAGEDAFISLHADTGEWTDDNENPVPYKVSLPANLFIIGTVNIDETTYMFSPKVLDRANVIEFRVTEKEIEEFLNNPVKPELKDLRGAGAGMASDFVRLARQRIIDFQDKDSIKESLVEFFKELKKTGSEFGYRTSSEIFRFAGILRNLTEAEGKPWPTDDIIDAAILQKLLPKLHGSKKKLEKVLLSLGLLCIKKDSVNPSEILKSMETDPELIDGSDQVRFKRSLEKILRMKRRADQDGFTSFAEA